MLRQMLSIVFVFWVFCQGCAAETRKAGLTLAHKISTAVCRMEPILEVAAEYGAEPGNGPVKTSTSVRGFSIVVEFPDEP